MTQAKTEISPRLLLVDDDETVRSRVVVRKPAARAQKERVSSILLRCMSVIIEDWLTRVKRSKEFCQVALSDHERIGYLPKLIEGLVVRLKKHGQTPNESDSVSFAAAVAYGKMRKMQGYTPAMLVHDSRMLEVILLGTLQNNLSSLDLSSVFLDVMTIADEVDAQLTQAMDGYLTAEASVSVATCHHSPLRGGALEDITDRKLLEGRLLQAQQKYRDIVEHAVIGIFQSTPEGRYITVNPALAAMLGYDSPEDLMASITDFTQQVYVDPKSRAEFKRLAEEQGAATKFESQAYRKDGSKVWLCANVWAISKDGVVVGYEGMNEDVTQRKLLEDELRQAQKMEAVGQLAGGIAHDFNNTLSIITGYSDLLQMKLPVGAPSHRHAEEIGRAGHRAAGLIRQLLAFSRKQVIQPVVLDLNVATREIEKMMHHLIAEDIAITFKRSPDLGRVNMDPGQVEQILMNLAVNARDAMPQGGSLCIETANVELDETYTLQTVHVPPGPYVMLSVSDTGCGMDWETQCHIFEPFFTTKEVGKGTGLGLSTVYGIVKQNAGHIKAHSELGKGTTFRLYLPRIDDAAKLSLARPVLEAIPRGTETVLIVEDEEPLRVLARICLESNGYSVLDAPNAAAALELAKKQPGRIHLLLTDVVMPGMSGRELAKRLTALRGIKVLYVSGYNRDLTDHHGILDRNAVLLEKPFTLHSLLSKVYKVLHTNESVNVAAS